MIGPSDETLIILHCELFTGMDGGGETFMTIS